MEFETATGKTHNCKVEAVSKRVGERRRETLRENERKKERERVGWGGENRQADKDIERKRD